MWEQRGVIKRQHHTMSCYTTFKKPEVFWIEEVCSPQQGGGGSLTVFWKLEYGRLFARTPCTIYWNERLNFFKAWQLLFLQTESNKLGHKKKKSCKLELVICFIMWTAIQSEWVPSRHQLDKKYYNKSKQAVKGNNFLTLMLKKTNPYSVGLCPFTKKFRVSALLFKKEHQVYESKQWWYRPIKKLQFTFECIRYDLKHFTLLTDACFQRLTERVCSSIWTFTFPPRPV